MKRPKEWRRESKEPNAPSPEKFENGLADVGDARRRNVLETPAKRIVMERFRVVDAQCRIHRRRDIFVVHRPPGRPTRIIDVSSVRRGLSQRSTADRAFAGD